MISPNLLADLVVIVATLEIYVSNGPILEFVGSVSIIHG